jgi:hypothetical protein
MNIVDVLKKRGNISVVCRCVFRAPYIRVGTAQLGRLRGNDEFKRETVHGAASRAADAFTYAMVNVHEEKPFKEDFRTQPNQDYGFDILDKETKIKMGSF